jgi:hypothetical protein
MDTEIDVTDIQPPSTAFETGAIIALALAAVLLTSACAVLVFVV